MKSENLELSSGDYLPIYDATTNVENIRRTRGIDVLDEESTPELHLVEDYEAAILGLCNLLGGRQEYSRDKVFEDFNARFKTNLGRVAESLKLSDGGEEVSLDWEDLDENDRSEIAHKVMDNMTGVLGLTASVKQTPTISRSDVADLKPHHNPETLRDILSDKRYQSYGLSPHDLTRIYLRNSYPEEHLNKVIESMQATREGVSRYEHKELYLRRGIAGIEDEAIERYVADKGKLSASCGIPKGLSAIILLKSPVNKPDVIADRTARVSMALTQIKKEFRSQLAEDIVDDMIEKYFGSYVNSANLYNSTNKMTIDNIDELVSKYTKLIRRGMRLQIAAGVISVAERPEPFVNNRINQRRNAQVFDRFEQQSNDEEDVA